MKTPNDNLTVGMDVIHSSGDEAMIVGYVKGWYEIQFDGGETKKVRAKDIQAKDEEGVRTMATQLKRYAPGYEDCTSHSGRKSLCTGDDLSHLLSGMEPEEVCRLAEKVLGLDNGELVARYENLNPGQKRMNAGNRIRSAIKAGDVELDAVATIAVH